MNRTFAFVAVSILALVAGPACRRNRNAAAPPPPAYTPPPPPPPPCDVVGSWAATSPFTPQEIDVSATEKAGVYNVRVRNGANLGVATVQTSGGMPVDTSVTNPIYKCSIGTDCNLMNCSFTGGAAPVTWKRIK
jgi:hypothetical protein